MRHSGAAILVVCGAFLAACGSSRADYPDAGVTDPLIRRGADLIVPRGSSYRGALQMETVRTQAVREALTAPAQVEADPARISRITPPVPGRVVQIFVRFGDAVAAGQPLLVLDSPDIVAAQAEYLTAESELAQRRRELARQQDLHSHAIGAQRDVEAAQTAVELAEQERDRARERLQIYHQSTGTIGRPLSVSSPVAGHVVDFHVAPGEYHDTADVLMTVADLSTVWVTANVQENALGRITEGEDADATFLAYPEEVWSGHVLFVGELLDPDTRTLQVRVAFDNTERRLHPGMFATVTFHGAAQPRIVIPATAVLLIGDANYVFVETGDWRFQKRRVTPGANVDATHVVVTDGLREGDRIVTTGAIYLQ